MKRISLNLCLVTHGQGSKNFMHRLSNMPFSQKVASEVLVLCARRCCICRQFCGARMQLHHIIPEAKGGTDTEENCIPLCLNCHEEVGSYNACHPISRKFSPDELKRHRDAWFDFVRNYSERLAHSSAVNRPPSDSLIETLQTPFAPKFGLIATARAQGRRICACTATGEVMLLKRHGLSSQHRWICPVCLRKEMAFDVPPHEFH